MKRYRQVGLARVKPKSTRDFAGDTVKSFLMIGTAGLVGLSRHSSPKQPVPGAIQLHPASVLKPACAPFGLM